MQHEKYFSEKLYANMDEKLFPEPFLKNQN